MRTKTLEKKPFGYVKLVQAYLNNVGVNQELHTMDPADLDKNLSKFFVAVRQKDGSEYQPSYLRCIMGSVEPIPLKAQIWQKWHGNFLLLQEPLSRVNKNILKRRGKETDQWPPTS